MNKSIGPIWGLYAPLAVVAVISTGQLLFKLAAGHLDFARPLADLRGLVLLGIALALYGGATLLWVAVLRHAPLGRAYPIMALSFVIVPLAARLVLKEPLSTGYWAGAALVIAGLVVISRIRTS